MTLCARLTPAHRLFALVLHDPAGRRATTCSGGRDHVRCATPYISEKFGKKLAGAGVISHDHEDWRAKSTDAAPAAAQRGRGMSVVEESGEPRLLPLIREFVNDRTVGR
jgi:hypothetical protein